MNDMPISLAERLTRAPEGTLREIIRNSETYMAAQLQSGLASNQRAMTLTSLLAAATVVLGGSAGTLLTGDHPRLALGWVCAGTAMGLLFAMAFALSVARPKEFDFAGNSPASWLEDIEQEKTLEQSLAEQAAWYADMIVDNNACIAAESKGLRTALNIAWLSLAIGGSAAMVIIRAQQVGLFAR